MFILFLATAAVQAQENISQAYESALRRVEQTGRMIFRHDRAAAIATDAVIKFAGRRDSRVRGWITEDRQNGIIVIFVGSMDDGNHGALFSVIVPEDGTMPTSLTAHNPLLPLSGNQAAQFRARQLAIGSQSFPCSADYNTVVVPDGSAGTDPWHVYLLPGTTQQNILPASGFRVEVDANGTNILGRRAFTKSCVHLEDSTDAVSLTITHMLDPTPTEIHIFLSLLARKPLLVATAENYIAWEIRDGRVIYHRSLKEAR